MLTLTNLVSSYINSQHGWAVRDQFEATFEGAEDLGLQNLNALHYIKESVDELLNSRLLDEDEAFELVVYYERLAAYLADTARKD